MKSIECPEWVKGYCIEKEALSDCVERYKFICQGEYAYMYICNPYPGIHLWANDVHMYRMPIEQVEQYHFIKLNYCTEGRAEVLLGDSRYVYLEKGTLSVDKNEAKENFLYPGARYAGLELVLDMYVLEQCPVQAFSDCGIYPAEMEDQLGMTQGSYLSEVTREWREAAETVMDKLKKAEGKIEDYRFYTIELLYLLLKGGALPCKRKHYLTRGQRKIVADVVDRITADLKSRYTIEALAKEQGISPSSLKKYFEQVYGMPISEYLRERRMEHACSLLTETDMKVADIAAEAGYSNQGKFGSVFKRYTNHTPLEYKRLYRERRSKE